MTARAAPLVSVILPYRNRVDVLAESIRSVLDQTWPDFELVLVDDASTDGSAAVARSFADDRIVHVTNAARRGAAGARNAGLAVARGRYVAFQDSDDLWLPHKVERQLRHLEEAQRTDPRVAVAGCRWAYNGSPSGPRTRPPARETAARATWGDVLAGRVAGVGTPQLLVDRAVAGQVEFDETIPAFEERDYLVRNLRPDKLVTVVDEVLCLVRRGRGDHVANAANATAGVERILAKYAEDLEPAVRDWYHAVAMRYALQVPDRARARTHLRAVPLSGRRALMTLDYLLGCAIGVRGPAVTTRLGISSSRISRRSRPDRSAR